MEKNEMDQRDKQKPDSKKAPEFKTNRRCNVLCLITGIITILILTACASIDAPRDTTDSESENEAPLGMGAPVQNSAITVIIPGSDMYVAVGDTLQLTAELYPEQGIQQSLSWSIETGPAQIDQYTGQVTITGCGKILVVASMADGSGVFGEATLVGFPAAPNFTIDYFHEQTNQVITATYEYSSDGITWSSGNNSHVKLINGQELKIRAIESGIIPPGEIQVLTFTKLPEHFFNMRAGVIIDYDPAGGKDVVIPSVINGEEVTGIGSNAFENKALTSVVIPSTVTAVGDSAFRNNYLTSVVIPNSVTSIGDKAFSDCSNLASIAIPDSVTSIGSYAFLKCSQLTSITIPDSVKSIGMYAFFGTNISQVTIPDAVTDIGIDAFSGLSQDRTKLGKGYTSYFVADNDTIIGMICTPYSNLDIPSTCNGKTITKIGWFAFSVKELQSVTFPEGLEEIESYAFSNNRLTSLTIPATLKSMGMGAFLGTNSITKIVMKGDHTSGLGYALIRDYSSETDGIDITDLATLYMLYGKGIYTADRQDGRWSWSSKVN